MIKACKRPEMINYRLAGGVDETQSQEILAGSFKVLEEIGVECSHQGIRDQLGKHGGITVKGNRIFYDRELVEAFIKRSKKPPEEIEPIRSLKLHTPYHCTKILDMNTREVKDPSVEDLRSALRLCNALELGNGWHCGPLTPQGVDPRLQRLIMLKTCVENSNDYGGEVMGVWSLAEAEAICKLGTASKRKPPYISLQFSISPLKFDAPALDTFYHYLEEGKSHFLSVSPGTMPTAGATGPISLFGLLMQGMAENFAGEILVALLNDRDTISQKVCSCFAFDMKYATVTFGSPEAVLLQLIYEDVNAHIFGAGPEGRLHSMGKQVDSQVAAERAFGVLLKALQGATDFVCGGMISGDEVFSPEQLVIDYEIVKWAERFIRGFEFDCDDSIIETIKNGVVQGDFFSDELTVNKHQDFYWMPDIFEHPMLGRWIVNGAESIQDKARKIAHQKIAEGEFKLAESIQQEIDEVFEECSQTLLSD